jgi:hypothetical protein
VPDCDVGLVPCGGTCADLETDPDHCGDCDAPCGDGKTCTAGVCLPEEEDECADDADCPAVDGGTAVCIGGFCGARCPDGEAPCTEGCCPWATETVDPVENHTGGWRPDLALDGEGRPHIAHRGARFAGGDRVHYVHHDGLEWTLRLAAVAPVKGWQASIALGDDEVLVGFAVLNDDNTKDMVLGRWTEADGPTVEIVDRTQHGSVASIAFGPDGDLHGIWEGTGLAQIVHGVRGEDDWTTETVDLPSAPSWMADLRVDARGIVHLAYNTSGDLPDAGVHYGRRDGEGWSFEHLAGPTSISRVSLALDAEDRPHLAWYQQETGSLHYGRRDGDGWWIETVDDDGDVGWNPSLALDPGGHPQITYGLRDQSALRHARRLGPGAWEISVVDAGPSAGRWSSLAIDADGRPHVAYSDAEAMRLKYAVLPDP